MKNIAFLSMDSLDGFVSDDELAIPFLNNLGFNVDTISWRQKNDWDKYEMAILRTTWDYQNDPGYFLSVLNEINSSSAILQNDFELIKWNINKKYLKDLEGKNIDIVPTIWKEKFDDACLEDFFSYFNTEELIIKPVISANADNTFRIKKNEINNYNKELHKIFKKVPFMIQPFMKNIIDEGEYSLFYFGNDYSHAILKKPKPKDFRVQEEHGGIITSIKPEKKLINIGRNIITLLSSVPLYSRIDLVRNSNNNFELMEVELIEPALYFRTDALSPKRFASAIKNWFDGAPKINK